MILDNPLATQNTKCLKCSMEMIVSAMEENPNKENIMKAWKDYTTEDPIVVREKVVKATKPETINSCRRKPCPDVVCDFTGFTIEPVKELMKETVDMGGGKKGGD